MNFNQIADAMIKTLSEKTGASFLSEWALRDLRSQINGTAKPGWQHFDLNEEINVPKSITSLYNLFKEILQFQGMAMVSGQESYDEMIWAEITEILAAFREVLVQNFQVELPKARVVSMVTEMVESGYLKEHTDKKGQKLVSLNENPYDIRIRIIKAPTGPAPEETRQKEVGLVVPARRLSNTGIGRGYDECYRVPKKDLLDALRQVSPADAECLANLFQRYQSLVFHIDEAEIVP